MRNDDCDNDTCLVMWGPCRHTDAGNIHLEFSCLFQIVGSERNRET